MGVVFSLPGFGCFVVARPAFLLDIKVVVNDVFRC